MGLAETTIIYTVIGFVVASAMWLAQSASAERGAGFRTIPSVVMWTVLWPFFAPILLGKGKEEPPAQSPPRPAAKSPRPAIRSAQTRLLSALAGVEGVGEVVLEPQVLQIQAMMRSLERADIRLQEMQQLLETPEFDMQRADTALAELADKGHGDGDPRVRSLKARRRNIERLETMRDRTREELDRAVVKMEEISSQVMLLRFASQPETKLADLLKDVGQSVEDLAQVILETSEL